MNFKIISEHYWKKFAPILILILLFANLSCKNKNIIYHENILIPNSIWDMNKTMKFYTEINEISVPYNLYLNVKHTQNYSAVNLWLFISSQSPEGKIQIDTLECMLTNYEYEWLGKGRGDIKNVKIIFKDSIAFPVKGEYIIEIQHGMRTENLPEIVEIGLTIEKCSL